MTAAPTIEASPAAGPHRRRLRPAILAAVAALALLLAVGRDSGGDPTPAVAPTFVAEDVRDPAATLSLPMGRPVILNFFAAWCEPCRKELPALEEAHRRHRGEIDVIGIDVADSRTRAVDLLDATGVTFATGYDPHRRTADSYRVAGMPTTVFVGADGRVLGTVRGPLDLDGLDSWVERLRKAA